MTKFILIFIGVKSFKNYEKTALVEFLEEGDLKEYEKKMQTQGKTIEIIRPPNEGVLDDIEIDDDEADVESIASSTSENIIEEEIVREIEKRRSLTGAYQTKPTEIKGRENIKILEQRILQAPTKIYPEITLTKSGKRKNVDEAGTLKKTLKF